MIACLSAVYACSRRLTLVLSGCSLSEDNGGAPSTGAVTEAAAGCATLPPCVSSAGCGEGVVCERRAAWLMEESPRSSPHWPIQQLRCPQKRGPSAAAPCRPAPAWTTRGGVASRNAAACKADSRLGAALRRSLQRRAARALTDECKQHIDGRRRHLEQLAQLGNDADERLDLHRSPMLQVLEHRHLVRPEGRHPVDATVRVDPQVQSQPLTDGSRLRHHGLADGTRFGIPCDDVDRCVRERADWIEAQVAPQLEPDLVTDVAADGRVEAGPRA